MPTTPKNAGHLLGDLSALYLQRNKLYADNYRRFGQILVGMFPRGLTLETEEEFNRFALFCQNMHKLTRYANSIKVGGHADSLDDIAVYSMLAQECDNAYRSAKEKTRNRPRKSQRRSSRRSR